MKIFDTKQIKELDAYTIEHKPIASFKLMERAADYCYEWINIHIRLSRDSKLHYSSKYIVFCGSGNNGGDGLVISRLLASKEYNVEVYMVRYSDNSSEDNKTAE